MSFQELVRQSMKTEEQLQQERANEKKRIFHEQNEIIIEKYLTCIKDDILSLATSGKIRNGKLSNTVEVPNRWHIDVFPYTSSTFASQDSQNFFGEKYDTSRKHINYIFTHGFIEPTSLTYSNIFRLKLIFDEVKRRALLDGIEVSDPFILMRIHDLPTHAIKETRKIMMQNNSLSVTFTGKTHYSKMHDRWEGDYCRFSLAVDYHCTV